VTLATDREHRGLRRRRSRRSQLLRAMTPWSYGLVASADFQNVRIRWCWGRIRSLVRPLVPTWSARAPARTSCVATAWDHRRHGMSRQRISRARRRRVGRSHEGRSWRDLQELFLALRRRAGPHLLQRDYPCSREL